MVSLTNMGHLVVGLAVLFGLATFSPLVSRCSAQDQFGGQSRANAAERLIVLAVQQGISSLPPTSAQSFTYTYDPETLTFVPSERLGPTAFLSARTIGEGKLSLLFSSSYFELCDSFGPVTYSVVPKDGLAGGQLPGFVQFKLSAKAKVGIFNLSASYGIRPGIEVFFGLPITVVDADASQSFTTFKDFLEGPPQVVGIRAAGADEAKKLLADDLGPGGELTFRRETFRNLGFDFNEGTQAGVGRITMGAKAVLYAGKRLRFAVAPQLFLPSPSQNEFSGSDSAAILPHLLTEIPITDFLRFHLDTGYDYDFTEAELRRFLGVAGTSFAFQHVSFDLGVSTSVYDAPIRWTPSKTAGLDNQRRLQLLTAVDDNTVGDTFVDFVTGVKFRVSDSLVIAGVVTVPVNDEGFRPDALGTVAVEGYF